MTMALVIALPAVLLGPPAGPALGKTALVPAPPFGDGLRIVSGVPEVDAVLEERLATLEGIPVARTITVTRTIEGGDSVSETSKYILSDFREEQVPAGMFDVPSDYRYQEPTIVAPTRE